MRVNGILRGLQDVATFMNVIHRDTSVRQWDACLKKIRLYWVGTTLSGDWTAKKKNLHAIGPGTTPTQLAALLKARHITAAPSVSLEEAQALRREIDKDLGFLRADTPPDRPFDDLVAQLNKLKLVTAWRCDPLASNTTRHSAQAILKTRWNNGVVERWAAQSWPVTTTLMDHFYAILGKAIETGALSRLKVCRECGKYLVVADLKTRFCPESRKCHDAYHNRVTHAGNRKYRREQAVLEAQRLAKDGKSKEAIMDTTGLPLRVVEKVFDGSLPAKTAASPIPQAPAVPSPADVARIRRAYAEEQRQAAAYAKKSMVVECPQCHRRRTVPIGARAFCDHTDRAGKREDSAAGAKRIGKPAGAGLKP